MFKEQVKLVAEVWGVSLDEANSLLQAYPISDLIPGKTTGAAANRALSTAQSIISYTPDEFGIAFDAVEQAMRPGDKVKVQFATVTHPTADDLAQLYAATSLAGFTPGMPAVRQTGEIWITEIEIKKNPPVAARYPLQTGQWQLLLAALPTLFVTGTVIFGLTQLKNITNLMIPLSIILVAGAIVIVGLLARPAERVATAITASGKKLPLLPSTSAAAMPATKKAAKPTRDDVEIHTWFERDRQHVEVRDKQTGKTVIEWWDERVSQAFEDGFFEGTADDRLRNTPQGRKFINSVLDYAEHLGVLQKSSRGYLPKAPGGQDGKLAATQPATQFVQVGDRVRYLKHGPGSKYRHEDWPKDAWLGDKEVDGTVTEYHPGFADIEPWAVVKWDNGASTAIDKDNESTRWQRLTGKMADTDISLLAITEGDPLRKFCCRQCGDCAPEDLLQEGKFPERIEWLRKHYKDKHPGMWGKAVNLASVNPDLERVQKKITTAIVPFLKQYYPQFHNYPKVIVFGEEEFYAQFLHGMPKEEAAAYKGVKVSGFYHPGIKALVFNETPTKREILHELAHWIQDMKFGEGWIEDPANFREQERDAEALEDKYENVFAYKPKPSVKGVWNYPKEPIAQKGDRVKSAVWSEGESYPWLTVIDAYETKWMGMPIREYEVTDGSRTNRIFEDTIFALNDKYLEDFKTAPEQVETDLQQSMMEEAQASKVYREREEKAEKLGYKKIAQRYEHIAGEEDTHYQQFGKDLHEIESLEPATKPYFQEGDYVFNIKNHQQGGRVVRISGDTYITEEGNKVPTNLAARIRWVKLISGETGTHPLSELLSLESWFKDKRFRKGFETPPSVEYYADTKELLTYLPRTKHDPYQFAKEILEGNIFSKDELPLYAGISGTNPQGIPDAVWRRVMEDTGGRFDKLGNMWIFVSGSPQPSTPGLAPRVLPPDKTETTKPQKPLMDYTADSPEIMAQTIDMSGLREQLDEAFQAAIARTKSTSQGS